MDSQLKIGFIGAGNMAFGIAKGILSGESGESCLNRAEMFEVKVLTVCSRFRKCSACECQSERTLLQEPGTLSGTSSTLL